MKFSIHLHIVFSLMSTQEITSETRCLAYSELKSSKFVSLCDSLCDRDDLRVFFYPILFSFYSLSLLYQEILTPGIFFSVNRFLPVHDGIVLYSITQHISKRNSIIFEFWYVLLKVEAMQPIVWFYLSIPYSGLNIQVSDNLRIVGIVQKKQTHLRKTKNRVLVVNVNIVQ